MLNKCASLFVKNLEEKNLHFNAGTDNDGDSVVEFPYKGKVTKLYFCGEGGHYLSMYLLYEQVPDEKIADVIFTCNDLNCEYKWFTFYVDKEKDVIIHNDAILSENTAAAEAFELLMRILKIAEDVKPQIMKAIYA